VIVGFSRAPVGIQKHRSITPQPVSILKRGNKRVQYCWQTTGRSFSSDLSQNIFIRHFAFTLAEFLAETNKLVSLHSKKKLAFLNVFLSKSWVERLGWVFFQCVGSFLVLPRAWLLPQVSSGASTELSKWCMS